MQYSCRSNHPETPLGTYLSSYFESLYLLNLISQSVNCHLIFVKGFVCPHDLMSYVVWGNVFLVGPPKTNWSWVSG